MPRHTVVINTRHQRPLFRRGCFLLDDGCQDDGPLQIGPLRSAFLRLGSQAHLARNLAKLFDYCPCHLFHGLHTGELVRIWKKITFQAFRLGGEVGDESGICGRDFEELLARTQTRILYSLRDVEHVQAFGNYDGVEVHIAMREAPMDIQRSRAFVKQIFPSF